MYLSKFRAGTQRHITSLDASKHERDFYEQYSRTYGRITDLSLENPIGPVLVFSRPCGEPYTRFRILCSCSFKKCKSEGRKTIANERKL